MKARTSGAGRTGCEAVQYSDQMQCARCGLSYDANDQDPPECQPRRRQTVRVWQDGEQVEPTPADKEYGRQVMSELMEKLRT